MGGIPLRDLTKGRPPARQEAAYPADALSGEGIGHGNLLSGEDSLVVAAPVTGGSHAADLLAAKGFSRWFW